MTRKPDYNVSALNKHTDEKGVVGAAWKNNDGTIAIILDPFVVLAQRGRNMLVTLFPADGSSRRKRPGPDEESDEIPF